MEKDEALDAVRNATVHCSAATVALNANHLDHAIGQLDSARDKLCVALSYCEERKEAEQEAGA